jgi:PPOX class probable F420-dependent enzyme
MAPRGARTIATAPRNGSIEQVRAAKRTLVVTFRRDGRTVATPVWAAHEDGALYVRSERTSGKVKRLRNDRRVLIAPCTVRGKPLGAPLEALGSIVPAEGEAFAERVLAARYGLGRELFERTMDLLRVDMCYLRIDPEEWSSKAL